MTPLPEFSPEYTYPDNDSVPEELRGRTVAEASAALQANFNAPTPPPPAPPVAPSLNDSVTREEFQAVQQAVLAQLERVAAESSAQLVERAKRAHPDVFRKYEPEVVQVLQRVPRGQWTSDVIDNAVTFVKGRHFDELAAERSSATPMYGTAMRSTGGGGYSMSAPPKPADAGFARWQDHAEAVGIGPREIEEFCREQDTTPDEFFKQFGSGLITDAVTDVSWGGKKRNGAG